MHGYEEIRRPLWRHLMTAAALLVLGVVAVFALGLWQPPDLTPALRWSVVGGLGLVGMFLVVTAWVFSRYHVRCSDGRVQFGYRGFGRDLPFDQVELASEVTIRWFAWGGVGWRVDPRGRVGYIVGSGPGIEVRTARRRYVFNCERPRVILDALSAAGVEIRDLR